MYVSKHTIYAWKAKYGGMSVSEARKGKQENARLKKLVAELTLDKDMLQSVIRKELPGLVVRRSEVRCPSREPHTTQLLSHPGSTPTPAVKVRY
jgi:hypothetical protein